MKRREFIGLVGGAVARPLTASAQQQGKIVTIGILASEPWPPIETFGRALDDLGYNEGCGVIDIIGQEGYLQIDRTASCYRRILFW